MAKKLVFLSLSIFCLPLVGVKESVQQKALRDKLLNAARHAHLDIIRDLVENQHVNPRTMDKKGNNGLLVTLNACQCQSENCNHAQVARYLITKDNAIVTDIPEWGRSAVHIIAAKATRIKKPIKTKTFKILAAQLLERLPFFQTYTLDYTNWLPKQVGYLKDAQEERYNNVAYILEHKQFQDPTLPSQLPSELAHAIADFVPSDPITYPND